LRRGKAGGVLLQSLNAEKFGADWLALIEKNVIGRFGRLHFIVRKFDGISGVTIAGTILRL
jgi:hypothetical protein